VKADSNHNSRAGFQDTRALLAKLVHPAKPRTGSRRGEVPIVQEGEMASERSVVCCHIGQPPHGRRRRHRRSGKAGRKSIGEDAQLVRAFPGWMGQRGAFPVHPASTTPEG
jgi:hypothetical protein